MYVPMRIRLEPCSTANGQSPLIPIDSVSKPRKPNDSSFLIVRYTSAIRLKSSATLAVSSVLEAIPITPHI